MQSDELKMGQVIEMKKPHPCGSKEWEIIRLGADVKIRCLGCDRIVMLERVKLLKRIKRIKND
jgi:hypothetical protein